MSRANGNADARAALEQLPVAVLLDLLADAVADRLGPRLDSTVAQDAAPAVATPWLTQKMAAVYLGCSVSRIKTLTVTGDLPFHRDGARPLYHRDELDTFVRKGGARCP
jgi:excisionase family DNA binding protein